MLQNCTDVNSFRHVLKIRNRNDIDALYHIDVDSFQRSKCTEHSSRRNQIHSFANGDSNAVIVLPFNGDTCVYFKIVDGTFTLANNNLGTFAYIDGILPKGPYPLCLRMADRALLAGCPRHAAEE